MSSLQLKVKHVKQSQMYLVTSYVIMTILLCNHTNVATPMSIGHVLNIDHHDATCCSQFDHGPSTILSQDLLQT